MDFWTVFWTVLLVLGLIVFAGLAVVVSIGGFFDIKRLFRSFDARQAEDGEAGRSERGE